MSEGSSRIEYSGRAGEPLDFPIENPCPVNPAPVLKESRESGRLTPVRLPSGDQAWLVTSYVDNWKIFSDARFSRSAAAGRGAPAARRVAVNADSMTAMDPPEQTRLRRTVMSVFTARRVREMESGVRRVAQRLADQLIEQGPGTDLMDGYCRPLPLNVICDLLGVPEADRVDFDTLANTYLSVTAPAPEIAAAADRLHTYFRDLVDDRTKHPAGDLLSDLAQVKDQGGISSAELEALSSTLLLAGYAPVANHLANSLVALHQHPEQRKLFLRSEEDRTQAVEELLRYVPAAVLGGTIRVATENVDLESGTVRAGEAVLPAIVSGNRDATAFDQPDVLDVRREKNPHLAFGGGPHRCLGAQLARMELKVGLETLLARIPDVRPEVGTEHIVWNTKAMQCGPALLPVTW